MRKLKLALGALDVQSFQTDVAGGRAGTVRGHDTVETEWCTGYPECISRQCDTRNDTCYGTCGCTKNCETLYCGTANCS